MELIQIENSKNDLVYHTYKKKMCALAVADKELSVWHRQLFFIGSRNQTQSSAHFLTVIKRTSQNQPFLELYKSMCVTLKVLYVPSCHLWEVILSILDSKPSWNAFKELRSEQFKNLKADGIQQRQQWQLSEWRYLHQFNFRNQLFLSFLFLVNTHCGFIVTSGWFG